MADFNFPEGMRTGDLYDLIVGTQGLHLVTWPRLDKRELLDYTPSPNLAGHWRNDNMQVASADGVLYVKQLVLREHSIYWYDRSRFWRPTNLLKYSTNEPLQSQ
ncbi:hypothetical protein F4819DRAFT_491932 [Hypoxylon fuscum]|nr:hypothetical protein F4819DRAFT_491932 [Hypoxylon fuscum]